MTKKVFLSFCLCMPFFATQTYAKNTPATQQKNASPLHKEEVAAILGNQSLTMTELDQMLAAQILSQMEESELYELRSKVLEQWLDQQSLIQLANLHHLSPEAYLKQEVEKRIFPITDQEAKEFYEKNKEQLMKDPNVKGKTFGELKKNIMDYLSMKKQKETIDDFLKELKSKAQILLKVPRFAVGTQGPSKGPQNAKVTIVEFSDYQCPFCRLAQSTLNQVLLSYPTQVRLIFRDFPSPSHPHAFKAAEAGLCAQEQGKFWEMHDLMFAQPDKLSVADLKVAAGKIQLQPIPFQTCLLSGKYEKAVQASIREGQKANMTGTPTFFINGRKITGAQPFEKLKKIIEEELQIQ